MKEFKKGLIFGIGTLTPILLVFIGIVSVYALVDNPTKYTQTQEDIVIDQNTSTKYVWIEDQPSTIQELNSNIDTVKSNGVIIGTYKTSFDGGKTLVDMPITKNGYVITFKTPPLATDIEKLDLQMSLKNMKRDGGKTVIDKIADMKTTVDTLSTKVTTLETKVK